MSVTISRRMPVVRACPTPRIFTWARCGASPSISAITTAVLLEPMSRPATTVGRIRRSTKVRKYGSTERLSPGAASALPADDHLVVEARVHHGAAVAGGVGGGAAGHVVHRGVEAGQRVRLHAGAHQHVHRGAA